MLLSKFPRTASREDLLVALWDDESFVEENTLNVNITRLRKSLMSLALRTLLKQYVDLDIALTQLGVNKHALFYVIILHFSTVRIKLRYHFRSL